MSTDSRTPMALYKANLELVLRIGALLQENRQRWMQAGAAGTSEAIQRTLAQTERMLTTNDWTSLSAMPGEDFWRSLQGGSSPLQGSVESAVRSQAEFAEGLKQAFAEWQQQSIAAIGGVAAPAATRAFSDLMQTFNAAGRPGTGAGASGKETGPAEKAKTRARAPAAKTTAAKKKTKVTSATGSRSRGTRKTGKK